MSEYVLGGLVPEGPSFICAFLYILNVVLDNLCKDRRFYIACDCSYSTTRNFKQNECKEIVSVMMVY